MKRLSSRELWAALPSQARELVERLVGEAAAREARVYLVGGPVRDHLLGRAVRDVDLVVEPGDAAAAVAREAAPEGARVTVHERFGTAKVAFQGVEVDLAGARRESYAHPGALPRTRPGSLQEDLLRRDFTVNALAVALHAPGGPERAEVVDPSGGVADLERRRLRILHPHSFHDDPTRALRAARLVPRLGFHLSRDSRHALRAALRDGAFGGVSGDRFRREIERLFHDAALGLAPADALRRLSDWYVLPALEPGLELSREATAPLRRLGRAVAEPPWEGPRWRPWVPGLCLWLAPAAPALRRRTLRRLAVRGELEERMAGFPRERERRLAALGAARGRGAVDAALAELDEERLVAVYASAEAPLRRKLARWAREDRQRRAPVGGADLLEIGLSGPAVGRALARIRRAWLDGTLRSRDEALALARELGRGRTPAARPRRSRGGR